MAELELSADQPREGSCAAAPARAHRAAPPAARAALPLAAARRAAPAALPGRQVDEMGTEAAAVTAIAVGTSAPIETK